MRLVTGAAVAAAAFLAGSAAQATVIYYPAGSAAPTGLPDGNINVTGVNRVYATWYNAASSGKSSSDPSYGVTRSGQTLKKGIVAVDPKVIPLGALNATAIESSPLSNSDGI